MHLDHLRLDKNKIYEKEFKSAIRGYNQEEVDEFLDIIIDDYDTFVNIIAKYEEEIERLKSEVQSLKNEEANGEEAQQPLVNQQVNSDILKRLSNLEKAVFGD